MLKCVECGDHINYDEDEHIVIEGFEEQEKYCKWCYVDYLQGRLWYNKKPID